MSTFEQDNLLINRLAYNDKEAIELIYKDNYSAIQSYILQNNGSVDEAKDIFQEAVIILFEKAIAGNFVLTCQLKTFIYSICKRLWLKRLKQMNRYSVGNVEIDETVAVEDEIESHEKKDYDFGLMENAMNKIGEPCKSLLDAYYIQKKPMQQIANEFGYTNADNAKTQKYKCLMRLKKLFFAQYKNGG